MNKLSQISARSMQLFLAIVREGNLSEVARNEGLAASSLSRVVQQLEQALETQLLYRNTRAVIATEAGHIYADTFRAMLQQLADAQTQVAMSLAGAFALMRRSRLACAILAPKSAN